MSATLNVNKNLRSSPLSANCKPAYEGGKHALRMVLNRLIVRGIESITFKTIGTIIYIGYINIQFDASTFKFMVAPN